LSYEQSIKPPSIETSVKRDRKDLHLHISLRLGESDLAALEHKLPRDGSVTPTREQLSELASKIYEARRTRYRMLDRDLLGEPAWDMLLALYCLSERGERLSITSLSLAADLPQATGHRWQLILAQRELLDQIPDESDGRRQFVKLSNKGRDLLESYLTQLFRCGNYFAS
jgi:DNA-binding MarR family transcriptional regulator